MIIIANNYTLFVVLFTNGKTGTFINYFHHFIFYFQKIVSFAIRTNFYLNLLNLQP